MKKNKLFRNAAIILSAMLLCGTLTACGGGDDSTADAPASQGSNQGSSESSEKPASGKKSDGGASFDEGTGVLTLSGAVTKEDLSPYENKDEVTAVIAQEGTVLPEDCTKLFEDIYAPSIDLTKADASAVTNMSYMFWGSEAVEILLGSMDTSHVTTMVGMFNNCRKLETLDLSGLKTDSVEELTYMFADCWELKSINLNGFACPKVTKLSGMFDECGKLETLDLSGMDATNFADLSMMFENCASLKELDLSGWHTEHLFTFYSMFSYCVSLEKVNLSGFNTEKVYTIDKMFDHCESLKEIIVSDQWKLYDMSKTYEPFTGCVNLVGGNGTKYDEANNSAEYARIDTPDTPGYLTAAG